MRFETWVKLDGTSTLADALAGIGSAPAIYEKLCAVTIDGVRYQAKLPAALVRYLRDEGPKPLRAKLKFVGEVALSEAEAVPAPAETQEPLSSFEALERLETKAGAAALVAGVAEINAERAENAKHAAQRELEALQERIIQVQTARPFLVAAAVTVVLALIAVSFFS